MTLTFVVSDFPATATPMQRRALPTAQELPNNTFLLDDSNTSLIKYTSPFTRTTNDTCTGGTCTRLGSASGSLEFAFNGTDVWLFGKTGGIARVFLDGLLVDVLDSSERTYNGSALWAANGLSNGSHTIKLAGVEGDRLNLLVDFFGVNGVVSTVVGYNPSTDPNYLSPEKLTPIIIGSVLGFLALLAIGVLVFFLRLRRKKRKRISKSGIKLVSFDGSTKRGSGGQSRDTTLKERLMSGIMSIRRRSSMDKESHGPSGFGFGGRGSSSTDGENPFKTTSYASTNAYPTAPTTATEARAPYSSPTSTEAFVPLFALPASPTSGQWTHQQQHQRPPLVIPSVSRTASTYSSAYTATYPAAPVPQNLPRHEERPESPPSDRELGQESTPLMEARPTHPPSYYQHEDNKTGDTAALAASRYSDEKRRHEFVPATQSITLQPKTDNNGGFWSASTVSTFPTTAVTSIQSPPLHYVTLGVHNEKGLAPPREQSPRPPSFMSFDTSTPMPTAIEKGMQVPPPPPPPPSLAQAKTLKGPRPRGASNASVHRPGNSATDEKVYWPGVNAAGAGGVRQGMRSLEERDRFGGVRVGAGPNSATSSRVGHLRVEDEEPESPIDPAVQTGRVWN